MLVEGVACVWACGISAAGKDVGKLDHGDDVWCVATACTFGMVGMDCAAFKCGDGGFNEAGLVQGIRVDECLNVKFVADAETGIDSRGRGAPIFV